jgi:hypothetical protein
LPISPNHPGIDRRNLGNQHHGLPSLVQEKELPSWLWRPATLSPPLCPHTPD